MAAGVVVAEGDVDGDAGEGGAKAGDGVCGGLLDEGAELAGRGGGEEEFVAAVELVADDVSGEDGEADVCAGGEGLSVDGGERGLPEAIVGIDERLDGAGLVDGGVVGVGGGGGGEARMAGHSRDGRGVEAGSFGGVAEGVEVDVGEEESGEGGGAVGQRGHWAAAGRQARRRGAARRRGRVGHTG